MKTHLKPILWLVGGITVMFMASLALELSRNTVKLRRFSDANQAMLEQREKQSAENIFASAENAVADSLERGEMEKFEQLLQNQRATKGLQELSLFDHQGIATYSSDPQFLHRQLPADLSARLQDDSASFSRRTNGSFEIYHPQKIKADCLRCHVDWKEGNSSGILVGRFSTESLESSQQQWAQSIAAMKHSQLVSGLLTTLVIVIIFGTLAGFVMHYQIIAPLVRVLKKLTTLSDQVRITSSQLSASSQSIADGASEQAAALEETSSALEEIATMTQNNAVHAHSANDLAAHTHRAAATGTEGMTQMNHAMEEIQTASSNIAKIIKTIDEIAFQTNILALNAAVEAARAGEAGLGFAVVAEEVRNLAKRSAVAARETADIIDDSLRKTQNGARVSTEVAKNFQEITDKARQVNQLVAQIATASQEQNQGIGQLNTSVRSMDAVTQNNAANAEESAGVAVELNAQADTLRAIIEELSGLLSNQADASMTISGTDREASSAPLASPRLLANFPMPLPATAGEKKKAALKNRSNSPATKTL
jgi:methyl-accepting chemotaxis protein